MNILIISEQYKIGGLETNIATITGKLDKNNFFFAFGEFTGKLSALRQNIFTGFHFNNSSTINDFREDVEKLVDIIKTKKIDAINVHPFYSIFPAIFAAHLTNTKLFLTNHGLASFTFCSNFIDTILYYYSLENAFSAVFCVSSFGLKSLSYLKCNNAIFLPNCIDSRKYKAVKSKNSKQWALVSRLDSDKYAEISKFFQCLPFLDIEKVDIYGDGFIKENLEELCLELKIEQKVEFKGFSNNLDKVLQNNYCGVIGVGRVALEGLFLNLPTLLAGNGKICGLINEDIFNIVKYDNFTTYNCNEISLNELKKQIEQVNNNSLKAFQLRSLANKEFESTEIAKKFTSEINKSTFQVQEQLLNFYKGLLELDGTKGFYDNENVLILLKKNIETFATNPLIKAMFIQYKHILIQNSINIQNNSELTKIKIELEDIKRQNDILWEIAKRVDQTVYTKLKSKLKQVIK